MVDICEYELPINFHAKRLSRNENIPKRFMGYLLLKHPVHQAKISLYFYIFKINLFIVI